MSNTKLRLAKARHPELFKQPYKVVDGEVLTIEKDGVEYVIDGKGRCTVTTIKQVSPDAEAEEPDPEEGVIPQGD